nr:hypothetical protein [uncultured Desulfuromonas sp.]
MAPEQKQRLSQPFVLSLLLWLLVVAILFVRYGLPIKDGDIWFHLAYGRYFIEQGTLTLDHRIFSWTPSSNETIYCAWLSQIAFYLLYKLGGLKALFAMRYLGLASYVILLAWFARQKNLVWHPVVPLLAALGLFTVPAAAFAKPELFSFILMNVFVFIWWKIKTTHTNRTYRFCYLFPLLMLIWVNSHGVFLFGLFFLVVICCGEWLNYYLSSSYVLDRNIRRHLFIATGLSFLLTLVTPYGWSYQYNLYIETILTRLQGHEENLYSFVVAYKSIFKYGSLVFISSLLLLTFLMIFWRRVREKRIDYAVISAVVSFTVLYVWMFRTTYLVIPILAFSSVGLMEHDLPASSSNLLTRRFITTASAAGVLLVLGMSVWLVRYKQIGPLWSGFGVCDMSPVSSAEYIQKYFPDARLANTYNTGAYFMWALWPKTPVMIDARRFPYEGWLAKYVEDVEQCNLTALEEQFPSDLWFVDFSFPRLLLRLNGAKQWQLAHWDKGGALFVHKDLPLPDVDVFPPASIDLRNFRRSRLVLFLFMDMGKVDIAEQLMANIQQRFGSGYYAPDVAQLTRYVNAVKALQTGELNTVVSLLQSEQAASDASDARMNRILALAYNGLALQKWMQSQWPEAVDYVRKAYKASPQNPVALYNLGVAEWYLAQTSSQPPQRQIVSSSLLGSQQVRWKQPLKRFVTMVRGQSKGYEAALSVASQVLRNEYREVPPLMKQ